jgi:hypothetical protein
MCGVAKETKGATEEILVHCYVHSLKFMLSQSASFLKPVRVFFTSLCRDMELSFFKIDKEPQLLYAEVEKRLPSAVPRWNHTNRLLETLLNHKTDFEKLFITIIRMVVTGTQKVCALLVATWHF